MTDTQLRIEGVETLVATMRSAADKLRDLKEANDKTAALVVSQARAVAPRRSGRLASSLRAASVTGGAQIEATAPYGAPIHWGWPSRHIEPNPFVTYAAQTTEAQWTRFYEQAVDRTLETVKGA